MQSSQSTTELQGDLLVPDDTSLWYQGEIDVAVMCLFSLDSSDGYPFGYNVFNDNAEYTFYYEIFERVIHRLNETENFRIYDKMFYFPVQRLLSFTWHWPAQTRFTIGSQCENLIASGTSWKKWLLWEIAMSLQPIAFQCRIFLGHLRKEDAIDSACTRGKGFHKAIFCTFRLLQLGEDILCTSICKADYSHACWFWHKCALSSSPSGIKSCHFHDLFLIKCFWQSKTSIPKAPKDMKIDTLKPISLWYTLPQGESCRAYIAFWDCKTIKGITNCYKS